MQKYVVLIFIFLLIVIVIGCASEVQPETLVSLEIWNLREEYCSGNIILEVVNNKTLKLINNSVSYDDKTGMYSITEEVFEVSSADIKYVKQLVSKIEKKETTHIIPGFDNTDVYTTINGKLYWTDGRYGDEDLLKLKDFLLEIVDKTKGEKVQKELSADDIEDFFGQWDCK